MQNHNDDTIKMCDTVLRKIYLSLYLKGLCVRGSWRPNRTATYWPPLWWPSVFLSCSPGLLNRGPGGPTSLGHVLISNSSDPQLLNQGPTLLGAGFLYRILSPTGLVSKLTDFLSSSSYIIVQHPLLLVGVTIALIQPIHGQGYNSDIPWPDAPVIYISAFAILTARPGHRSIYNKWMTKREKMIMIRTSEEQKTTGEISKYKHLSSPS